MSILLLYMLFFNFHIFMFSFTGKVIDEAALASTKGDEGSSSLPATILPNDPHVGAFSHIPSPRSPPPSFEDFIEEEVIATLAEGVRGSAVSPTRPAVHRESSVPNEK